MELDPLDGSGNLDFEESEQNEEEINENDSWKVIDAYFSQHGLVSQQIGSFNQFVNHKIQDIINEYKIINITPDINYASSSIKDRTKYEIEFGDVKISGNPQHTNENGDREKIIYPNDARVRNLDYLSSLSVNVTLREKKGEMT